MRSRPIVKIAITETANAPVTEEWQLCNTQACVVPHPYADKSMQVPNIEQMRTTIRGDASSPTNGGEGIGA